MVWLDIFGYMQLIKDQKNFFFDGKVFSQWFGMESPTCIELQIRHVLGHPSNEYVYIWGLSDWVLAQNLIIEICFSYFILCSSPDLRKDNTGPGLCPISPSGGVECVLNKGAAGLSCLKTVQISHPCSEHITPLSYLPPLSLHYTLHCKIK